MIFNSFEFIFLFLPAVYGGYLIAYWLGGWNMAFNFLAAASLAFYGMWGAQLFVVLACSVAFNYAAATVVCCLNDNRPLARTALYGSIAANLLVLVYLKYTNFLVDVTNQVAGTGFNHLDALVPVGVSFFTFVQIGYLVEAYNRQLTLGGLGKYIIFSAFFPCVTAGPLVLHREIMQQLEGRGDSAFDLRRLVTGLTMFAMGLFKKVVLADSIAPYANQIFDGVAAGQSAGLATSWIGSTCYALQLYFDFSGYSDMAIGLAFIFGIKLPLNFDSPFKATNISDFWRRWHITMTRFFTAYIYTGLAMSGMRTAISAGHGAAGKFLRAAAVPVVVTFLVAGVWHGAGWNFVVYGLIHGIAIAICLAWREFRLPNLGPIVSWALTMGVVVSGLVVFRAANLQTAGTMLAHMWGLASLYSDALGPLVAVELQRAVPSIVLLVAIVLFLPNTQQILHRDWISSDDKPAGSAREAGLLAWRPAIPGAVAIGAAFTVALASIGSNSTFLYYQF